MNNRIKEVGIRVLNDADTICRFYREQKKAVFDVICVFLFKLEMSSKKTLILLKYQFCK